MYPSLVARQIRKAHPARSRKQRPRVEPLEGRALLSGPGSLDPSFGSGGIVTTAFSGISANDLSLLRQPDGKLVAVGVGMARYNSTGSLDTSFGKSGKVSGANGVGALYPAGTSDAGKILVGGSVSVRSGGTQFTLTRYLANGSVDTSFGTKGTVTTAFGYFAGISSLAVQPDGKIVAAGYTQNHDFSNGGVQDLAIARYNANGTLDTTFGSGGKVATDARDWRVEVFNAVALQADGKIVAAGESGGRFVVARYNTNGMLDTGFGSDHTGIALITAGGDANALAIQGDGRILLGGYTGYDPANPQRWALARLNADGTADSTFGIGGVTATQVTPTPDGSYSIMALGVQADGKIVAAGNTDGGLSLARYDTAGVLDPTFGVGGVVTTLVPGTTAVPETHALVIQPDGNIVVGGKVKLGSNTQFVLARYTGGGPAGAAKFAVPTAGGGSADRITPPLVALEVPTLGSALPTRGRSRQRHAGR